MLIFSSVVKFTAYGTSRFAGTALQFILLLYIGRIYGQDALGAFSTSQSLVTYLGTIFSLGLPAFILRRSARHSHIKSSTVQMWVSILHSYLTILLFIACTLTILHYYISQNNAYLPYYICIIGSIGFIACRAYAETLKGQSKTIQSSLFEFILPLGLCFSVIVFTYFNENNKIYIISALPIGYTISALVLVKIYSSFNNISPIKITIRRLAKNIRELFSLTLVQVGNVTLLAMPVLISAKMLSLEDAAIIGVSARIIGIGATATSIIVSIYVKDAIASIRSSKRISAFNMFAKMSILNAASQALLLIPLIVYPEIVFQFFSIDLNEDAIAQNAVRMLASLRLARGLLGTPEVFLANAGKSGFDLIGHALALITFFSIILLNEPSLYVIALATGIAALCKGIISTTFVAILVLLPKQEKQ